MAAWKPTYEELAERLAEVTAELAATKQQRRPGPPVEGSRQQELLRWILDRAPILLVLWDPNLRRFTLNRHAETVLGWTTDEANDGDFMDRVYPDPRYRAEVAEYMQSLAPGFREWMVATKDGRRVPSAWANIRLSDETMLGIGVDLRQIKKAEEALQRQSKVLAGVNRILAMGLGEHSQEQMCQVCLKLVEEVTASRISFVAEIGPDDLLDGLTVSDSGWEACRMHGGAGPRTPPCRLPLRGIYERVLRDGTSLIVNDPAGHPDRVGLPEGHPPLTAFLGVPLKRKGRTFGIVAVGNREGGYRREDQRALEALAPALVAALGRKRAEDSLREAKDDLERKVRQRTAELSHTVDTLQKEVVLRREAEGALRERSEQLRSLASELTLAEQRERRRLAEVLHDNLQQLLVGATFQVSRLSRSPDEAVTRTAAQAQELLDQSIECARSLTGELSPPILHEAGLVAGLEWLAVWMRHKHGLDVALQTEAGAAPESEDMMVLLFQSVRELLFNTVKHAGVVKARVGLRGCGDQVEVTVSDRGAGFDPPAAMCREGGAGGFGLFSIQQRLDLLGGEMEIDSRPGHGSRITLRAPRKSELPMEEAAPIAPGGVRRSDETALRRRRPGPAGAANGRIRVLLVDDHVVMRHGLSHLLGDEPDIEVIAEASDGQTAVEMVRRLRPDVVMMDINMPAMDGIAATRQIRAECPEVQVIGLSMFEESERAEAMRKAGAADYLTKRGPSDALVAAIRACAGADAEYAGKDYAAHPDPNATSAGGG